MRRPITLAYKPGFTLFSSFSETLQVLTTYQQNLILTFYPAVQSQSSYFKPLHVQFRNRGEHTHIPSQTLCKKGLSTTSTLLKFKGNVNMPNMSMLNVNMLNMNSHNTNSSVFMTMARSPNWFMFFHTMPRL